MAFLDSFANPNYTNANVYRFERRRKEPREEPTSSVSWGPSALQQGIQSRGMLDRLGRQVNEGPIGIENTTGFGQTAPNVVYDQGPEQFEKELKLKKRQLDINEKQVDALAGLRNFDAETRRLNAGTAAERNAIAMFKAQNPNMILKASAGGNYFAIDPQSGETVDTGIPVGNMTQEGAIGLRNQGQMDVQGLRNTGAETVANIGATSRERVAEAAANAAMQRLITGGYLQAGRTEEGTRPNTQNEQVARAQELVNTNPELAPFIQFTPDGKGVIVAKPQSQMGSGQTSTPNQNKGVLGTLAEKLGWTGTDTNTQGPTMDQWRQINTGIFEPRKDLSKNPIFSNVPGLASAPFFNRDAGAGIRPNPGGEPPAGNDKRARAIAALQAAKKQVTEETIAAVMARMK